MSKIVPTIGRKLYFRPNGMPSSLPPLTQNDPAAPLDATIVYVWPSTVEGDPEYSLNLAVFDHAGNMQPMHGIPLVQDGEAAPAAPHPYAEWMPFQVGQAKEQEAEKVDTPNAVTPIPATSSDTSQPTAALTASASPAGAASNETGIAKSFDFGVALAYLKSGKPVTRAPWKAQGVYVYLVPAASYPAQTAVAKKAFGENGMVPYMAYLAIKRAVGQVCVFTPGVDSLLAEDWELAE